MTEAVSASPTTFHSGQPTPQRLMAWEHASRKRLPDFIAKRLFGRPLAPTPQEWQRIQEALLKGDPAMDRVVEWMFEVGPREGKDLFEQALEQGIDTIDTPPPPLRDFFNHVDTDPPWLRRAKLDDGARASHLTGKVSYFVLRDMALMGGYAYFNSMNQTLAMTSALRKGTRRRLGETAKWYFDVTSIGGMERFGEGFKTTLRVRLVHALVRRALRNKPDWDHARWGVPINQIDMLSTYLAFGPVTLAGASLFGVMLPPSKAAPLLHRWRYIGWLMGVEDQWLSDSLSDGLRKLHHCSLTHRLPDDKIRLLGEALRDEPLQPDDRTHAGTSLFSRQSRWLTYQQHMSNSSLILGIEQRRQLGLPVALLPWYAMLTAPFRFMTLNYYLWRGGKTLDEYAHRVRCRQAEMLQQYFGEDEPDIIRPDSSHPAHV